MRLRPSAAAAGLLALAACSAPRPAPTPTPPPAARPAPPPAARPQPPAPADWMDAPQTPGDWRYLGASGGQTRAMFGDNAAMLTCDRARRTVTLSRPGTATGSARIRILTESTQRTIDSTSASGPPQMLAATFAASDPILDAMAFSKGRFAVETAGLPTLYLPSWPEVTRVIEDCR